MTTKGDRDLGHFWATQGRDENIPAEVPRAFCTNQAGRQELPVPDAVHRRNCGRLGRLSAHTPSAATTSTSRPPTRTTAVYTRPKARTSIDWRRFEYRSAAARSGSRVLSCRTVHRAVAATLRSRGIGLTWMPPTSPLLYSSGSLSTQHSVAWSCVPSTVR